jgi:hypothetical protein
MKNTLLFLMLTAAFTTPAAPLREQDYSARPINNVTLNRADRAFLTDAATQLILQRKAAEIITGPTATSTAEPAAQAALARTNIVDELSPRAVAQDLAHTLSRIEQDLQEVAKTKGIALPLEGSIEPNAEFERLLNTEAADLDRAYTTYAERNTQRLLDRFLAAAKEARDPQVRAFALRHVRAIYQEFKTVRAIERIPIAPAEAVAGRAPANAVGGPGSHTTTVTGSGSLPPGRAGAIFSPPRPDPIAPAK